MERGSVVTEDGDTVPLVASQIQAYAAEAEVSLKDIPLPAKADPIGDVSPAIEVK